MVRKKKDEVTLYQPENLSTSSETCDQDILKWQKVKTFRTSI